MHPAVVAEPPSPPSSVTTIRLLFAASLPCAGIAVCAPFAALGWFPDLCLHLSWVAALTLLPALIAVRRQPLRCSVLFVAMAFGLWPWVAAAYATRAPIPTNDGLSVATGNLYDFNPRRDEALQTLLTLDVDLLAVQEVLRTDEALLVQHWPHVLWSYNRDLFACGLLSRYPFSHARIHELEEYALIEAVVLIPDGSLRVFVVHLASPKRPERAAMRGRQLARLAELMRASTEPVLIAGDFNLSAAAPAWSEFSTQTQILRPPGPSSATWPRWLGPLGIDLDHIAGRGVALAPLETVVIPGSDHRALRTRVALRPSVH